MSATTTTELVEGSNQSAHEAHDIETPTTLQNVEAPLPDAQVDEKGTTAIIITTITGVTMISSLLNGLVTISLPAMAKDLQISDALLLWSVPRPGFHLFSL